MSALPDTEYMTAAEVAERWRLSGETVRAWARQGRIPSVTLGPVRRFRTADIRAIEINGWQRTSKRRGKK